MSPSLPAHSVTTVRILLSGLAIESLQAEIGRVMGSRSFELVSMESAVLHRRQDIDIALITRDVTGLSTKHELAPALQACYDVLSHCRHLQWIHIHSAGADRPIYVELRQRGVVVTTSSGTNAEVVTQTALAGLLSLARGFPRLLAAQRNHTWAPLIKTGLPKDLTGQTAVVVGWGPIGQKISLVLHALGVKVIAVRRSCIPSPPAIETVAYENLMTVLPRTDWLLLACPLSTQTRGLVSAAAFDCMPSGAQLVNVARGEVVDEAALISALQSGRLAGAYLDVFAHEPLAPESPLWDMPNVIVTPHSAGFSDGNARRVVQLFLDNLGRWLKREALFPQAT